MRTSALIALSALLYASSYVAASACGGSGKSVKSSHRRHHHHHKHSHSKKKSSKGKQVTFGASDSKKVKSKKPKESTSSPTSATASASASASAASSSASMGSTSSNTTTTSSNATTSSTSTGLAFNTSFLKKNGVYFGYLPDDGSGGGTAETMAQLNGVMPIKAATYGYYAQAQSGTAFDGQQLLWRLDDIKASGAVFEPAVMPTGGWQGLTASDNSQAVNIANVMKKFTDEGIAVHMRFAHEVNYYQTDGTYQGTSSDFKAGWQAVCTAMRQIAPEVKLFFTPNVANLDQYDEYYPDDKSCVDLIGIDYYPKDSSASFVDTMKPFHDKYTTSSGPYFAIGETGLGYAGTMQQRMAWAEEITSAATKAAMPNFVSASWFNYQKGQHACSPIDDTADSQLRVRL
ncbi:glycoside hydrolase family 26 protein [Mixia osmundae IAM 14324]|uniref:glycoside hydrolase family 26 protein n=1 Tax=Mixia osmundae (strain CBS 9802 / IAM 14324 / JCM 22182 / KY 12970) TaxID=764103 RepID=UPI0004A5498C|nr:glycoside hydrolase family 26 protein [Mixia osmundae IAM 14324]KEI40561.1 glycoside hydrolase family 26 protein [Mixia osmundae IAM 14324]